MIELFEQNIKKNERQSSKGNQLKWQKDNIWYIVESILIYDQDTKERVKEIIFQQMRKYQYLIEKR